jgi:hypothetical protein
MTPSATLTLDMPAMTAALKAQTRVLEDIRVLLQAAMSAGPVIKSAVEVDEPAQQVAITADQVDEPAAQAVPLPSAMASSWTEGRRAAVRDNWQASAAELERIVNNLPGPWIGRTQIMAYGVKVLKLPGRRSVEIEKPAEPAPMLWSTERKAVIRQMWAQPLDQIAAAVNALPGPAVNQMQVLKHGQTVLKLAWDRKPVTPVTPVAPVAAAAPHPVVVTDLATIRAWAAPRGIAVVSQADLSGVNARRHSLGLPAFEIEDRRRRA